MDIGRVVPRIVQQLRYRHAPAPQQTEPDSPEAEIRKRHDRALADANELFDDVARPPRRSADKDDTQQRVGPGWSAEPVRKPRNVANSSDSGSRKASCPLPVSISTKVTLAATAFSAGTGARRSEVGNRQSLVNGMMQK